MERARGLDEDVVMQERQPLVVEGLRLARGRRDLLVYGADVLPEGDRTLEQRGLHRVAGRRAAGVRERLFGEERRGEQETERDGDSTFHRDSSEAVR